MPVAAFFSRALFFVLILGFSGNGAAAAQPDLKGDSSPDWRITTLDELGYEKGYIFEGLQSSHAQDFIFPLPRAVQAGGGALRLHFDVSPQLVGGYGSLRIDIGGAPRYSGRFGKQDNSVELPLSAGDLKKDVLRVTVKSSLVLSSDRCLDERLSEHFLRIAPDSALALDLKKSASSLLGAWELLPKTVRISLPSPPREDVYAQALALGLSLKAGGKTVEYVSLPELGHVAFGEKEAIAAAIARGYPGSRPEFELAPQTNAALVTLPDRQLIALTPPFGAVPAGLLTTAWRSVATADRYALEQAALDKRGPSKKGMYELRLAGLGMDLSSREIAGRGEWRVWLPPEVIPANKALRALKLTAASAPVPPDDAPVMLYVYLNQSLQRGIALNHDGLPQEIRVELSAVDQKAGMNDLRIVAHRPAREGSCQGSPDVFPVQLSAASALVLDDYEPHPRNFEEMRAYLADGFDLYLSSADLKQAGEYLGFVTQLLRDNRYVLDPARVKFFDPGQPLKPAGRFVVVGSGQVDSSEQNIRFDRGKVRVLDGEGRVLLGADQLPGVTIAQIVKSGSDHGLWVKPAAPMPRASKLLLNEDDMAFIDDGGVFMTLSSRQPELAYIDYPEHQGWLDYLTQYRFWIFALLWLVLALVLLRMYFRTRDHLKKNQ